MSWMLRCWVLGVLLCGVAYGDDWPQWRGPLRTGRVPEGVAVPKALSSSPRVVWHIPVGFGLASPVVCGGRVFYLDNQKGKEVAHAADAATGNELWSAELDEVHQDGQSAPGPRCTPLAEGDRFYAQSGRGELRCYGAVDGKVRWRTNFVKDFGAIFIGEKGSAAGATRHGYTASPLIDGDHLIAEVGGKDAAIVCFDKLTGGVIWKSQNGTPAYAAPIITTINGTKHFIAFMADGVMGLNPADGKLLWHAAVKTSLARHAATPVVVEDLVMVASHQVGLIALRVNRDGDGFKAEREWTAVDAKINFASPVTVGRYLFGVGASRDLICIDVHSGNQLWSKPTFSGDAGHTHAGMIVMGENVLVLTDDGQLILVAATPKEYREVARARVCGQNWCNPAYADGKLFLRDAKELLCVELMP